MLERGVSWRSLFQAHRIYFFAKVKAYLSYIAGFLAEMCFVCLKGASH